MSVEAQLEQVRSQIEQVRSKMTEEQIQSVGSTLKGIENAVTNLGNDLIAANKESAGRKIELREWKGKEEEWQAEKSAWETEKDKLMKDADKSELTKEIETLREFKSSVFNKQRTEFVKAFESISKHPNWEKSKSLYAIPTEKEKKTVDGKEVEVLKWDAIDDAKMEQNIDKLREHQSLGIFGDTKINNPMHRKGQGNEHEFESPKTPQEAQANLAKWRKQQGV